MLRTKKIFFSKFRELTLKQFLDFLFNSLFRNEDFIIFFLELKKNPLLKDNSFENVIITKGNLSDLNQYQTQFDVIPPELQCNKYDGVKDFFIAHNGHLLQHINWIYYSQHPNRILCLRSNEAEFKFGLTIPQFRGKGLQPKVLTVMSRYLADKGYQRVFACAHSDNKSSIRGIEKAGFKRVGKTRLRKFFGVQISKPWRSNLTDL